MFRWNQVHNSILLQLEAYLVIIKNEILECGECQEVLQPEDL